MKKTTTLEDFLIANNISSYRLAIIMGDDPTNAGQWMKRVRGEVTIPKENFDTLIATLEKELGISIDMRDIDYQVEKIRIL